MESCAYFSTFGISTTDLRTPRYAFISSFPAGSFGLDIATERIHRASGPGFKYVTYS